MYQLLCVRLHPLPRDMLPRIQLGEEVGSDLFGGEAAAREHGREHRVRRSVEAIQLLVPVKVAVMDIDQEIYPGDIAADQSSRILYFIVFSL